ncbi:MAG: AbrB/MazE/SpoVT family DNA-binding domain-containing protein [Verrucomicrobiales bacterium]|nr:AbrB/MazE/SpoVT family DNA-binding domain-containing protein [Verrucomicrobiales bacterium]
MNARIQKWGNSLALRLPKVLADEVRLTEGTQVELLRTAEGLLLKARGRPRYRLADLVAGITPGNRHSETQWGPARGREIVA